VESIRNKIESIKVSRNYAVGGVGRNFTHLESDAKSVKVKDLGLKSSQKMKKTTSIKI